MDNNKWIIKSESSKTPPDGDPETPNWPENNWNIKTGKPENRKKILIIIIRVLSF
jgi:hypothetical protein